MRLTKEQKRNNDLINIIDQLTEKTITKGIL